MAGLLFVLFYNTEFTIKSVFWSRGFALHQFTLVFFSLLPILVSSSDSYSAGGVVSALTVVFLLDFLGFFVVSASYSSSVASASSPPSSLFFSFLSPFSVRVQSTLSNQSHRLSM